MTKEGCRTKLVRILLGVLVAGSVLLSSQAALAVDNGPTTASACMQRIFIGPTGNVSNSNQLNCTANDIRISRAVSVSPATCIKDTTFTLEATFETIVTANARYDAGFFFRTDGGPNARGDGSGATGTCSLSRLTRGLAPAIPAATDDGDTCGDLNAGTYELTFTIPNVLCSDTDGDTFLNLPNCTSWHSNQGTTCAIADTFNFKPDTKSKCVCDDTFQVPVVVATPSGQVLKKATQAVVTFEIKVKNNGTRTVTINSLVDDIYGDITTNHLASAGPPPVKAVANTTCNGLIGTTLAAGATSNACTFTTTIANPGDPDPETNTVTAELGDQQFPAVKNNVTGSTTIIIDLNATPSP